MRLPGAVLLDFMATATIADVRGQLIEAAFSPDVPYLGFFSV
jgi:hypothetical protein